MTEGETILTKNCLLAMVWRCCIITGIMKDCVALTTIVEKKMVKTVQNSCDYDGCVCCFVCNQQKERKTTKINNSNTLKQATALTTGYSI